MPNLNKGQTAWTNLFREFLQFIRFWRQARGLQFRYQKGRVRIYEINDTTDKMSEWTLVGAQRGINCSEDGRLWVTVTDETPGAGQARTQLFMDAGKTLEVARGDAADGATATLVAQNNSGLTGTVKLGTITSTLTPIILILDIDEMQKNRRAFDGTTQGTIFGFDAAENRRKTLGTQMQALLATIQGEVERQYIGTKLREFLRSTESTVLSVTEAADTNGDIQLTYRGVLADLLDCMADDTTPQTVKQNTVSVSSPVADPDNVGQGTLSVLATRQNVEPGKITLLCTAGKDTTLSEQFSVVLSSDVDGALLRGQQPLTIKKEWESRIVSVRLKLTRTITDTNDGGAQLASYVVDGETLDNTNAGLLYATVEAGSFAGGNNRRVRFYSDAARANLVAEGLRVGDGTVTMSPQNNSGLSGSVALTYTVDDLDIIVNLNPYKAGDIITAVTNNDRAGIIQSLFMDIWDVALPSSGSPTLPDDLIKEGLDHLAAGALPLL